MKNIQVGYHFKATIGSTVPLVLDTAGLIT